MPNAMQTPSILMKRRIPFGNQMGVTGPARNRTPRTARLSRQLRARGRTGSNAGASAARARDGRADPPASDPPHAEDFEPRRRDGAKAGRSGRRVLCLEPQPLRGEESGTTDAHRFTQIRNGHQSAKFHPCASVANWSSPGVQRGSRRRGRHGLGSLRPAFAPSRLRGSILRLESLPRAGGDTRSRSPRARQLLPMVGSPPRSAKCRADRSTPTASRVSAGPSRACEIGSTFVSRPCPTRRGGSPLRGPA
jgi:hypothetical protein